MTDLEIPHEQDRHAHYRFFEILPGVLSWLLLLAPIILSFINITAAVIFILAYLLVYFVRSVGFSIDGLKGYRSMRQHLKEDWQALVSDVEARAIAPEDLPKRPKWHIRNIERLKTSTNTYKPSDLIHVVITVKVEVTAPEVMPIFNYRTYTPKIHID